MVLKHIALFTCLTTCLMVVCCTNTFAQTNWQLKKEEDGILIYTATTPNSDFKSIKVECTIKARPSQLVAYLMDVDKQKEWVYNTKTTQLIKRIADNEMIFYSEVGVPWPCTNRDYISHITVTQPNPELIVIEAHSEADLVPQKEGKVRVKTSKAHWDVTRLGAELLKVVYVVQFDPSGSVPAWLTNLFVTKGPLQTFQKLREGVAKPGYKNARATFIRDL